MTFNISDATRNRAFELVVRAYSCIGVDDFAAFMGMKVSEAVDGKLYCFAAFL